MPVVNSPDERKHQLRGPLSDGRLRDELLNETNSTSLAPARPTIAAWVTDYNSTRPHSALGYQIPGAHAAKLKESGWSPALRRLRARPHCPHRTKWGNVEQGSAYDWMKLPEQAGGDALRPDRRSTVVGTIVVSGMDDLVG